MTKMLRRTALLGAVGAAAYPLQAQQRVVLARKNIFDGIDPFTLPRTKVEWTNDGWMGLPSPTLRVEYFMTKLDVVVEGPNQQDVIAEAKHCIERALVVGIISGIVASYVSSGTQTVQATIASIAIDIKECLSAALKRSVDVTVRIDESHCWSNECSSPAPAPVAQPPGPSVAELEAMLFRARLNATNAAVNHLLLN